MNPQQLNSFFLSYYQTMDAFMRPMCAMLKPKNCPQKSFNNKAEIKEYRFEDSDFRWLISYDVVVAVVVKSELGTTAKVLNIESRTTLKHIKEFLQQNGLRATNAQQIKQDYFY